MERADEAVTGEDRAVVKLGGVVQRTQTGAFLDERRFFGLKCGICGYGADVVGNGRDDMDLVVGALGIKAVIESASPEDHVVGAEFETEFKVADVFIQKDHLRVFCLCRDHFAGVGLTAALHSEMKIVIFSQENGKIRTVDLGYFDILRFAKLFQSAEESSADMQGADERKDPHHSDADRDENKACRQKNEDDDHDHRAEIELRKKRIRDQNEKGKSHNGQRVKMHVVCFLTGQIAPIAAGAHA